MVFSDDQVQDLAQFGRFDFEFQIRVLRHDLSWRYFLFSDLMEYPVISADAISKIPAAVVNSSFNDLRFAISFKCITSALTSEGREVARIWCRAMLYITH